MWHLRVKNHCPLCFPICFPGKLLVLIWSTYCMFIAFFYSSNLRAYLVAPAYEEFIDHPEQVIARGQTMYIPEFYRIARYAERKFYSILLTMRALWCCNVTSHNYIYDRCACIGRTDVEEFDRLPKRIQDLSRYTQASNGAYKIDVELTEEKPVLLPSG